jgi:hypothetical protein
VAPEEVPVYLLRVPVRYYRLPPPYFRGWHPDAPPRWGDRWGDDWRRHHDGWDRWDRRTTVRPAPLPDYQRRYHGPSYPHVEQQPVLHGQHYRYQPRDATVQRTYETQRLREAPPPRSHGDQRPAGPRPQVRDHRR